MKAERRDSGIETLKILAIALIVISHVSQTYTNVIDYRSLHSLQFTVLAYCRHFGALGNWIFFISSAWFLLRSDKADLSKWMRLLVDAWIISVIILLVTYPLLQERLELKTIIKCLFPTTFSNNWYLTCYLLFYPIHPLLNRLIGQMSQKALFESIAAAFILYFCISPIFRGLFFSSELIRWIIIYFVVAYFRNHIPGSKRVCRALILIGLAGFICIPLILGILGQHISILQAKMTYFSYNDNPFIVALALGLFLLFKDIHFHGRIVNSIARQALPIYLIHENLLMRKFIRLDLVRHMYVRFGEPFLLLEVSVAVVCILICSLLCAWLYSATLGRCAVYISGRCVRIVEKYRRLTEKRLGIPD